MCQSLQCLKNHEAYVEHWANGIWVCLLCAAKDQMAQDARDKLSRAQLASRGIILGHDHTHFNEGGEL